MKTPLVLDVIDESRGTSHHEVWTTTGCQIVDGRAERADVTEYLGDGPPRWVVHLSSGDAHGVYPPLGELRRDLEVFDERQHTAALVEVADDPFGPTTYRISVDGPRLTVDRADEDSDDDAVDLRFKMGFAAFLRWIHLDEPLGPALWFTDQIFELDVFALSLLDGVVSAPATEPPAGYLALPRAVELVCRLAGFRVGSADTTSALAGASAAKLNC